MDETKPNYTQKIINKMLAFLKNPYNLLFFFLIISTIFLYGKDLYIDSIWLDETQYMWDAMLIKDNPGHIFDIGNKSTIFPVSVVAILNIFFKSFTSVRLMGLLFALTAISFTYFLGKKLENEFVGLIAASILASNWWFYFLSLKGLIDVPVAAMAVAFAYSLYISLTTPNKKNILLTSIIGFLTIITKASGIFVIPFTLIIIVLHILTDKNKTIKHYFTKKNLIMGGAITILLIIFSLVTNFIKMWSNEINLSFTIFIEIFKTEIVGLMSTISIVFLVLGTTLLMVYRKRKHLILLAGYLFLIMGGITSGGRIPELRYFLPILPFMYIIVSIFLSEMIQYIRLAIPFKKHTKLIIQIIILIIVFVLIIKPDYSLGKNLIEERRYSYSGYIEAMNWVHNNLPKKGNELYIPNFFGCCSYNVGLMSNDLRRINTTYHFETFNDFKKFVEKNNKSTIYLMPDFWETGQREWINLRNLYTDQNKVNQIINLGFEPIYEVKRPVPTSEGLKEIPVIIILKKN